MYYFVLNKPPGCITGLSDPEGRPTVYDHVPPWYPRVPHAGRLDFNSEGLLLFTDDGRLARALLDHDVSGRPIAKVYHVKVRPRLDLAPDGAARLERLTEPLDDDDGRATRPARVAVVAARARATWIAVTVEEGRHHQVRRLCRRSDLQVVKLRRIALGPLELGDLPLRWCRPLAGAEVAACYEAALPGETVPPVTPIVPPAGAPPGPPSAPGRPAS